MQLIIKGGIIIATHKDEQMVSHLYEGASVRSIPDSFKYTVPVQDEEGNDRYKPQAGDPDPTADFTTEALDAIDDAYADAMLNSPVIEALIEEFTIQTAIPASPEQVKEGAKGKLKSKLKNKR